MGYYSTTLQKGSKGAEVKKWQEFLNTLGYGLSVDGDFGTNTYNATIDYQTKNGLGVDGIVGKNTWSKAGFKDLNTPVSAPTIAPAPTQPNLTYTPYGDTTEGTAKKEALDTALGNLNNYGSHNWVNEQTYNDWLAKKLNREEFSYDLNADGLYKQYADQYRAMGKLASEDVMGQAAAMTGGYGNSYAATVGNQAYQAYLGKLNDIVPELYQSALDKYTMEGQEIDSNIAALMDDYSMSFDKWQTGYGLLKDKYGIANSDFYDSATLYGTEQDSINGIAQQKYQNEFGVWEAENNNAWKQAEWDESSRRYQLENIGVSGGSVNNVSNVEKEKDKEPTGTTETKGWKDYNEETLKANQEEKGGSYYKSARGDIDDMIKSGKSYNELMNYAQEMVGNSYITKSEYMTLVQYIRKKMYG